MDSWRAASHTMICQATITLAACIWYLAWVRRRGVCNAPEVRWVSWLLASVVLTLATSAVVWMIVPWTRLLPYTVSAGMCFLGLAGAGRLGLPIPRGWRFAGAVFVVLVLCELA